MKKRPVLVHVTDHAILRWLEREYGVEVEAVRALLEGQAMTAAQYGAIAVRISNVKMVLVDNGVAPDGEHLVAVPTVLRKGSIGHA